jgi:CheY-like chemotaxis protein
MPRILLIDDDHDFRSMLRTALEHDGYTVEEAQNGYEGIRRYRAAPADLVITDILMPEQEGLETIRELRQEFPAVKIIAMSGGGRTGNLNFLSLARRFGALLTLQKPFTLQEFREAVHQALQPQTP